MEEFAASLRMLPLQKHEVYHFKQKCAWLDVLISWIVVIVSQCEHIKTSSCRRILEEYNFYMSLKN